MAKSRFEYVRNYELPDPLIPGTFIVVRIDGRGFHKFSDAHDFAKPNDVPAIELMNRAARAVMDELPDVVLAFGESDEYSFLIRRQSGLYSRRRSKINSAVCSIFTAAYVFYWAQYLPTRPLRYPPTFDSRVVLYPGAREVRDYFSWRQADTHINNLYNTCFWYLVHSGLSTTDTNQALQGTDSKDKNEMLFARFGINYAKLPEMFRKGSVLVRAERARGQGEREGGASGSGRGSGAATPGAGEGQDEAGLRDDRLGAARLAELELSAAGPPRGPADRLADGAPVNDPTPISGKVPEATATATTIPMPAAVDEDASASSIATPPEPPAYPRPLRQRQRREKKVRPYEGLTGEVGVLHVDIIGEAFWAERPWLLV